MKLLQFHRGISTKQRHSAHSSGIWVPRKRHTMASAKDDPTPVKVETSDEGLILQETVPVGERDGFGTWLD